MSNRKALVLNSGLIEQIQSGDALEIIEQITTDVANGSIIILPNGTGGIQLDTDGNARGDYAVDFQRSRTAATQVASGSSATILGGTENTAAGVSALICGGEENTVTAASSRSAICAGYQNTIDANRGFIGGGDQNEVNSLYGCVLGGQANSINGNYGYIGGGCANYTSDNYAFVPGGYYTKARHYGEMAHSAGRFQELGDAQRQVHLLRNTTSAMVQTELFTNGSTKTLDLEEGDVWFYTIKILGTKLNATASSYAEVIEGVITRTAGAGTAHVAGPTQISTYGAALGTVTVDDPDHDLRIQVTPNTADDVWWLAAVDVVKINGDYTA